MTLQRERNGIMFTINFPAMDIIKKIENNREEWVEDYKDIVNSHDSRATEEEINKDIDLMIEKVKNYGYTEDGINEIFDRLPFKKNKKLSRSAKPTLHSLNIGVYLEDCYGWETYILRIEALDELTANVELTSTVIHY